MSAVSSTIFKIRAHSDYTAPTGDRDLLSFRTGQPFYALATDFANGTYFVSTQFAVPFARSAVSGLVLMDRFDRVDLLSKEPPVSGRKASDIPVARQCQDTVIDAQEVPTPAGKVALVSRHIRRDSGLGDEVDELAKAEPIKLEDEGVVAGTPSRMRRRKTSFVKSMKAMVWRSSN